MCLGHGPDELGSRHFRGGSYMLASIDETGYNPDFTTTTFPEVLQLITTCLPSVSGQAALHSSPPKERPYSRRIFENQLAGRVDRV